MVTYSICKNQFSLNGQSPKSLFLETYNFNLLPKSRRVSLRQYVVCVLRNIFNPGGLILKISFHPKGNVGLIFLFIKFWIQDYSVVYELKVLTLQLDRQLYNKTC